MNKNRQMSIAGASSLTSGPSRVTVVMATYNGAQFLGAQLESLAAQTLRPVELIVSDDGSTDATVGIVRSFAATAPFPVRVFVNPENLGYGENFLRACVEVRTELIALCDQDDLWRPRKLEVAQAELTRTNAGLLVHTADLISEQGNVIGRFTQGIRARSLMQPLHSRPWGVYYGFTMVLRRDLLELIDSAQRGQHTFEHRSALSHDLWVYFLATSLSKVIQVPEQLASYRQHSANQTPHLRGQAFRRWTTSLGKAVDPLVPRDEIARHRAAVLADLGRRTTDRDLHGVIRRAVRFWEVIAAHEARRLPVYSGSTRSERLRSWIRLAVAAGYGRPARAGLGWRLGMKDLLAGVIGARRAANRT